MSVYERLLQTIRSSTLTGSVARAVRLCSADVAWSSVLLIIILEYGVHPGGNKVFSIVVTILGEYLEDIIYLKQVTPEKAAK